MINLGFKHLVTGEELTAEHIRELISAGITLKKNRAAGKNIPYLAGKNLAMLFDKPSLRTRFSFSVAMTELGGTSVESVSSTRKKEEPEDLGRVLMGYSHAIMVRTYEENFIERLASVSTAPVINGLSDLHHPCQILADLMALKETFGDLKGLTLTYIGDGNNILHSLLLLAPLTGMNVNYCCPVDYQPNALILKKSKVRAQENGVKITASKTADKAVKNSNAIYTDVWTSMGFEKEEKERLEAFDGFQVNEELVAKAAPNAVVMHCLPMIRGQEISTTLPDSKCSIIFLQSENRLHIQKALLIGLMGTTISTTTTTTTATGAV